MKNKIKWWKLMLDTVCPLEWVCLPFLPQQFKTSHQTVNLHGTLASQFRWLWCIAKATQTFCRNYETVEHFSFEKKKKTDSFSKRALHCAQHNSTLFSGIDSNVQTRNKTPRCSSRKLRDTTRTCNTDQYLSSLPCRWMLCGLYGHFWSWEPSGCGRLV